MNKILKCSFWDIRLAQCEFEPHDGSTDYFKKKKEKAPGSTRLAQWVKYVTFDLGVASLNCTSGVEFT